MKNTAKDYKLGDSVKIRNNGCGAEEERIGTFGIVCEVHDDHYAIKFEDEEIWYYSDQNLGEGANAHLIAAAPEMLEALVEYKRYFNLCIEAQDPPDLMGLHTEVRRLTTIINKAKGID